MRHFGIGAHGVRSRTTRALLTQVWAAAFALLVNLPCAAWADGLTYLAHPPAEPSAHPPLIVLLHGGDSNEADMITLWKDLPQNFVVVAPRAPFVHADGAYRWYRRVHTKTFAGDLATSRKLVDAIVAEALARFHADPNRVFLAGFSQGAIATYDVALREPGKLRGAAVLSGALYTPAAATPKQTPLFIGHGTADHKIPVGAAPSAQAALGKHGVPMAVHIYDGMGHETGEAEVKDLSDWLRERAK